MTLSFKNILLAMLQLMPLMLLYKVHVTAIQMNGRQHVFRLVASARAVNLGYIHSIAEVRFMYSLGLA